VHSLYQGSPNQAKWAASLPWFQWNRPFLSKNEVLVALSVFSRTKQTLFITLEPLVSVVDF
jgi:hypothetical protein